MFRSCPHPDTGVGKQQSFKDVIIGAHLYQGYLCLPPKRPEALLLARSQLLIGVYSWLHSYQECVLLTVSGTACRISFPDTPWICFHLASSRPGVRNFFFCKGPDSNYFKLCRAEANAAIAALYQLLTVCKQMVTAVFQQHLICRSRQWPEAIVC